MLAVQADGARCDHHRGPRGRRRHAAPGAAGLPRIHALQCGFCTPGMIMAVPRPARRQPEPDRGRDPRGHRRATSAAAPATRTSCEAVAGRGGGAGMTAVSDDHQRTHRRDRPVAPPQGGRAPDHRAHPLDRQHHRCPGCCTSPSCAARWHTRRSARSTSARPRAARASSASSPARTSRTVQGSLPCAWPRHAGHGQPGHTQHRRRPGEPRRRARRRRRRPRRRRRRRTRSRAIDVDYDPLPAGARHGGRGRRRRRPRPPEPPSRTESYTLGVRVGRGRHRRRRSRKPCDSGRGRRCSAGSSSSGSSRRSWSRARRWCSRSTAA